MVYPTRPYARTRKPGWIGVTAMLLAFTALVLRTLALDLGPLLPRFLVLEFTYLALYAAIFLWPKLPAWLVHVYLILQSALILLMLSLRPQFDFVVLLFTLLAYQVSLFFDGRIRWAWVSLLTTLIAVYLIYFLGFFRGLALALTTMASTIVIPAFIAVNQETEAARQKSRDLLNELEQTHRALQEYAGQVQELAAIQERNRLAGELHDTISQLIFSIALTTRSAQLLLVREPERVLEQLVRLQEISADALSQLRAFITQLRPPQKS